MSQKIGLQRLKILWAAICFIPALVVVSILSFSDYRPELMVQFSILLLSIASFLSLPLFFDTSLKTRLFFLVAGAGTCAAIFINLDKSQDAIRGEYKSAAIFLAGVLIWIGWTALEWVMKGFRKKD